MGTTHVESLGFTKVVAHGTAGSNPDDNAAAPQILCGSDTPTISAPKGSLYLRTDGSSSSTRAYINTDGGTTWTAITTAA